MSRYDGTHLASDYAFYQNVVRLEGGIVDDYIRELNQFLKDKDERLNKAIGEMETVGWVTLPDELGEAFANWSRNSSNRTIYNALFIMTNSFLEWALIEACRLTALYLKDDFIVYRKEQGIFKANNYLTEKLGIKLNANKEWSRFNVNQAVRNLIVHNGANVNKEYTKKQEEQPEYQLLKTNKRYFDMTETGFIYILRHDYILESHKLAKDFVQQTAEAIKTELVKNHDVKWE